MKSVRTQQFVKTDSKENIKSPHYCPFLGWPMISPHNSQLYRKCFHVLVSSHYTKSHTSSMHASAWKSSFLGNICHLSQPSKKDKRHGYKPVLRNFLRSGGRFKNAYELLNLRALKISILHKNCIFQCMGKIFCVEFQRYPLKYHTKYLTHTLKYVYFIHRWKFKSS